MEFKDIKDVLTFAAFRPEADNPRFHLAAAFPQEGRSVLVNISRGHCSWAFINRKGVVEHTGEADGEFTEVASQMGDQWRSNSEDGWIGISLNNRFIISLEHNFSRKKGWQEELRLTPKSVSERNTTELNATRSITTPRPAQASSWPAMTPW